jgi:YidC/Oxa1 family membrane protein insertase
VDRNLFLAFALSFAVLLLWTVFVEPPPAPAPTPVEEEAAAPAETAGGAVEPLSLPPLEPGDASPAPRPLPEELPEARSVEGETPRFRAVLSSRGAAITHWELRRYDEGPRHGNRPVTLTTGDPPHAGGLGTPFDELGFGDLTQQVFQLEQPGPEEWTFRYEQDGVRVLKTFAFEREDYRFELRLRVENRSGRSVAPRFAVGWPAAERPGQDFKEQGLAVLHEGGVERELLRSLGVGGFFGGAPEKVLNYPREVDWTGAETTYFLAAMLPDSPSQASARFVSLEPGKAGLAQLFFDPVELAPGQSAERVYQVYVGPKEPARLEAVSLSLERSIDQGWAWLAPLTRAFAWLLAALYALVPNYGVAIIVLTVLVRVVTAPLTNKQMRSMERMRAISPKLQEIKEKFGED